MSEPTVWRSPTADEALTAAKPATPAVIPDDPDKAARPAAAPDATPHSTGLPEPKAPNPRIIDEDGIGIDPRTTRQGLIDSITGIKLKGEGGHAIQIKGWLGPKLPDRADLEDTLPARHGFDRTHLWPRGFGDEAAAGMTYASPNFNRSWALTVENTIANFRASAAPGNQVHLTATVITKAEDPNVLDHVEYQVREVEKGNPGYGDRMVTGFDVTIDGNGNSSEVKWSYGHHDLFVPESNQSLASQVGPETLVAALVLTMPEAAEAAVAETVEEVGSGIRVAVEDVAPKIRVAVEDVGPKIRVAVGDVAEEAEELAQEAAAKGKQVLSVLGGLIGGAGSGGQTPATATPTPAGPGGPDAGAPGGTSVPPNPGAPDSSVPGGAPAPVPATPNPAGPGGPDAGAPGGTPASPTPS